MSALSEIFLQYGLDYLERHGDRMFPSHRKALRDILDCRTEACGGHVFEGDTCGKIHYAYHSCRNRSCPQNQGEQTPTWLDRRRAELLPVPYFHVVFTLPAKLCEIVRSNQEILLSVLMQAATASLMKLAGDPRCVEGRVSILSVLHSWIRTLIYHPHLHCLVPGEGLSPAQVSWLPALRGFLVPVEALSPIFRARFIVLAGKHLPSVSFPRSIWRKDQVVYTKPTVKGSEAILRYLGRHVHRIAISNRRIVSVEDGRVTFRYRDWKARVWKSVTLSAEEFIRRYLQQVLPKGFHKARFYGLLAPANRELLDWAKFLLSRVADPNPEIPENDPEPPAPEPPELPLCPHWGAGHLIRVGGSDPGQEERHEAFVLKPPPPCIVLRPGILRREQRGSYGLRPSTPRNGFAPVHSQFRHSLSENLFPRPVHPCVCPIPVP